MSRLFELDTEDKLRFIVDQMAQVRYDMQTRRIDSTFAQDRIDCLQKEYTKLKKDAIEDLTYFQEEAIVDTESDIVGDIK